MAHDSSVADQNREARRRSSPGSWRKPPSRGGRSAVPLILGFGINMRSSRVAPAELADRTTSIETELGRACRRRRLVLADTLAALATASSRGSTSGKSTGRPRRGGESSRRRRGARGWSGTRRQGHGGASRRGIADDGALLVRVGGQVERIISANCAGGSTGLGVKSIFSELGRNGLQNCLTQLLCAHSSENEI